MTYSFDDRYEDVQFSYQRRRSRQTGDTLANALLTDGYVTIRGWYEASDIGTMRTAIPSLTQMYSEPQSPSVFSLHNASNAPAFEPFFRDCRIVELMETIFEGSPKVVRDWAQVRAGRGYTGAFDEFYHIDDYRSRIKAFLYLSDVGPEDGCVMICPGMFEGEWHKNLSRQLDWVEDDYAVGFKEEKTFYDAYSNNREYQFAGTMTPFESYIVLKKVGIQPIALTGAAGTLHIWDSRMLHRHVPAVSGERYMLEMVFAEDVESRFPPSAQALNAQTFS